MEKRTIINAMDQNFCASLMFHLTNTLADTNTDGFKKLWCDGIAQPEMYQQTAEHLNVVITRCWFGETGQAPHWMTITLGPQALSLCETGGDLSNAIPNEDNRDWIEIDEENMCINLILN